MAPFAGISSVKNQTEAWDHAGVRINPQFDDGSQADEELTEYVLGSSFAYQLTAGASDHWSMLAMFASSWRSPAAGVRLLRRSS